MITIQIHGVTSVACDRNEVRERDRGEPFDSYLLRVQYTDHSGAPHEQWIKLFCDADAAIGLSPLAEPSSD
jgi:hypothetical protein